MSTPLSTPSELWKKWEGRLIAGKFPLQRWLGGSDHSLVFLTERSGTKPQKAAVKLIPTENLNSDAQLHRWEEAAKFSHAHLIRLFEFGHCQIDDTPLLYVVMDYADENLAEIIPLRPLSPNEVSEMLRPAAEALASLHQAGFVHGNLKPSNVMAVDNQLKLSSDGLHKSGQRADSGVPRAYDAPELTGAGFAPACDIWSLGMTLISVLTQNEPKNGIDPRQVVVPETIPQPLRGIIQQCLQVDNGTRLTASDIARRLSIRPSHTEPATGRAGQDFPKRRIILPFFVVALILLVWIGSKFMVHHEPATPASETPPVSSQPGDVSHAQSSAPFSTKQLSGQGAGRGSVLQQVMPDVSRNALNTITGRLKVGVQVAVDASGNVSAAKLVSPGPSKYFAARALAAARQWTFIPPQVNGQATPSEWLLRFQFERSGTQVSPAQIKP